jgi:uncharacterized protein (TIGR03437 family)
MPLLEVSLLPGVRTVLVCAVCLAARGATVRHNVSTLPLVFEENRGQTDNRVKFLSRGAGYTMFFTATETVLSMNGDAAVRMTLAGAKPVPNVEGLGKLTGHSSYFLGNDPTKWRTDIPQYTKVRYREVYAGIDVVFYGNQRQIESDFVVKPGADPAEIRLAFDGCRSVEVDAAGDLQIHTSAVDIRLAKPRVYQEAGGKQQEIAGNYILFDDRTAGFRIGDYDPHRPLVIDPVVYATFLGGSGDDRVGGFDVDARDSLYVTGYTESADFPTTPGSPNLAVPGRRNVFVAKLNPSGTELVYVAILGGSGSQSSSGIAVDTSGNAYVSGRTTSPDFPTTLGAYGSTGDSFVIKLNASGNTLLYSTLGVGGLIALDAIGNAYLAGSADYPATADFGTGHGFRVSKLNAAGSRLVYSVLLRGGWVTSITVDGFGSAYVTGHTYIPSGYPITAGALDRGDSGIERYDAFVTKLNPEGTELAYSTLLGVSRYGYGSEIAVDNSGSAYVSGTTDPWFGNVMRLNPAGSGLIYSADFGPVYSDVNDVSTTYLALAPSGEVWVSTLSRAGEVEVRRLNRAGSPSARVAPLFYAPNMYNLPRIRQSCSGDLYLAGTSLWPPFPVTPGVVQSQQRGREDASIVRFRPDGAGPPACTLHSASLLPGAPVAPGSIASIFGVGLAASTNAATTPVASLGGATIRVRDSEGVERQSLLYYASSSQINYLIPAGSAQGPAVVEVSSGGNVMGRAAIEVAPVAPGIYSANGNGHGAAAAVAMRVRPSGAQTVEFAFECGQQHCTPSPINFGDPDDQVVLLLFGTGIRGRSNLSAVSATVDGEPAVVQYAGRQNDFEGVRLPRTLAGRGEVDLNLWVDGRLANAVRIRIQ